jgi:hypothetical protein
MTRLPTNRRPKWLFLIVCASASIACSNRTQESGPMLNPPVPPGTKVDKSSDYFRYWPQGRPAMAKLNDNLILAIPPQYQKFWRQKDDVDRAPMAIEKIPLAPVVGFSFFMPDFSGYTPDNYATTFVPDRIDVVSLEPSDPRQVEPDAPGYYPPNMIKRIIRAGVKGDSQDLYGLKCYHTVGRQSDVLTCYGRRDDKRQEDIMLEVYVPPYERGLVNPSMQARYFTTRYGGLTLVWNTHSKNFPRWHDIDAQIWKFIDSWNIAGSAEPDTHR